MLFNARVVIQASHVFYVGTTNIPLDASNPTKVVPSKQLSFVTEPGKCVFFTILFFLHQKCVNKCNPSPTFFTCRRETQNHWGCIHACELSIVLVNQFICCILIDFRFLHGLGCRKCDILVKLES